MDPVTVLLADNSLTDTARLVAIYISRQPAGEWIELPFGHLTKVLHGYPGDEKIRAQVQMLERAGYVERRRGGRGHSDSFRWIDRAPAVVYPIDPSPAPVYPEPPQRIDYGPVPTLSDRVGASTGLKSVLGGCTTGGAEVQEPDLPQGQNQEGVGGDAREESGTESVRRFPLAPEAEHAITGHGELLHGCRGSLRDYLRLRVPPDRQSPYVQKIAGWRNGIAPWVWKLPDGSGLSPPLQNAVLADALNDLAASDERKMKREVGSPANLETKLGILLTKRHERERNGHARSAGDRSGAAGIPSVAGEREHDHDF